MALTALWPLMALFVMIAYPDTSLIQMARWMGQGTVEDIPNDLMTDRSWQVVDMICLDV
jgi:hypothetical protein